LINIDSSTFLYYDVIVLLHVSTILNCFSVIVGRCEKILFCQRVVEKLNKLPARDNDYCSITAFLAIFTVSIVDLSNL